MSKPHYKIIGTNTLLKAFCYDCILDGVPVSKANSFFRDDHEHCLMPAYAYDPAQPDNIKLQTLAVDVYYPDLVFNLEDKYDKVLALVTEIALKHRKIYSQNHLTIGSIQADIEVAKTNDLPVGQLSDGYHTIDELYEFRKLYNAALFNEWTYRNKFEVHKSERHHGEDEPCFGGGWFIVVAVLPTGQISNHYKMEDWDLFHCPTFTNAKYPFDGHTSADVLERLKSLINA